MLSVLARGGARHFHLGGPLEGPVLQQGELSMVYVGLQCSDMTSRGKFLGGHWGGQAKFWRGSGSPGTSLAPPLVLACILLDNKVKLILSRITFISWQLRRIL